MKTSHLTSNELFSKFLEPSDRDSDTIAQILVVITEMYIKVAVVRLISTLSVGNNENIFL